MILPRKERRHTGESEQDAQVMMDDIQYKPISGEHSRLYCAKGYCIPSSEMLIIIMVDVQYTPPLQNP